MDPLDGGITAIVVNTTMAAVRNHRAQYSLPDSPPGPKVTEDIDLSFPFSTAPAAQMNK